MGFVKSDGSKIKITFNLPISGASGNENYFLVSVPEYSFVPGGTLSDVTKAVKLTYAGDTDRELILEMEDLQRFESAAGEITVSYSGAGILSGIGGLIEPFTESFMPTGLAYKGNQNLEEHVEIGIGVAAELTRVYYQDAKANAEHIALSNATAIGQLIYIDDL